MQKREKRQKLSRQVEKPITDDNEYGILGNPEGALDVVWLVTGDMELQISPCRQKENVKYGETEGIFMVKTQRPRFHALFQCAVVSLLFFLSGCLGAFTQWGDEVSFMSEAPSFSSAELQGEKVAILSAVVGFGLEGYSLQVSRTLSSALSSQKQTFDLIPIQMALSEINQHGLASEYTRMISEYRQSGILNKEILEKLGNVLHARYVIQPSMAAFNQFTSGRLSVFGLRLFHTRISTLRLSAQIWDTRTGVLVWEASGEGTIATEDVREFRIPFEAIGQRLWGRILHGLGITVVYEKKWFGEE